VKEVTASETTNTANQTLTATQVEHRHPKRFIRVGNGVNWHGQKTCVYGTASKNVQTQKKGVSHDCSTQYLYMQRSGERGQAVNQVLAVAHRSRCDYVASIAFHIPR